MGDGDREGRELGCGGTEMMNRLGLSMMLLAMFLSIMSIVYGLSVGFFEGDDTWRYLVLIAIFVQGMFAYIIFDEKPE